MNSRNQGRTTIAVLLLAAATAAQAQQGPQSPAPNEQVVVPDIARRDVRPPRFPSNDFEVGLFAGSYSTQNFGASAVAGLKLGYHVTEDIFIQAAYAQTRVSDDAFRRILPGGVFPNEKETLKYYNLSAGYNILPGEVFIGSRHAKASALYVIAGVGSTRLVEQRRQTVNFGLGTRVLLADWVSLQVDVRDHVFSLDLLGKREHTHNLELTAGASVYF